jgi:hypothetical protein
VSGPERIDDDWVADRLVSERPVPRAAFRAALRRRLLERSGGAGAPAPRRLRILVTAYAGSGALLLMVAAASVAGLGPLAA